MEPSIEPSVTLRPRSYGFFARSIKVFRIFVAFLVCACLLIGVAIAGLYFLLEGKTERGSALVTNIEQTLQDVVGAEYSVNIAAADLSFSKIGRVAVVADNITILRKTDGLPIAEISTLETDLALLKTLTGEVQLSYVTISEVVLDASILGPGTAFVLPAHMDKPLNELGMWLSRIEDWFSKGAIKGITVQNAQIKGQILGRRDADPVLINQLVVEPGETSELQLTSQIKTNRSDIKIASEYVKDENGWRKYNFSITGIHAREWLEDPLLEIGFFANDGIIDLKGDIPFDENGIAFEPRLNLRTGQSQLRIGPDSLAELKTVELNFRLLLDRNQIELDPSFAAVGRLTAEFIGGLKPVDGARGYAGPIFYDLIMSRGEFRPVNENEKIVPVGIKMAGIYNREAEELVMDDIIFTTNKGHVAGQAFVGFEGETPSVRGSGKTDGISVAALKQFWPFFIADGAREWVQDRVSSGWISEGKVEANIPAGVLFRLKEGERFTPEQLSIETKISDLGFRAFGNMPDIIESNGNVRLEGMKISAEIENGYVQGFAKNKIQITSGSFETNDFADPDRIAKTTLTLDGDARSVAQISDREPLRVMKRMKVDPAQFSGKMHADVIAEFPLGRSIEYSDVKWNVLMDLENGKSTKKLADRKIEKANILIDANPTSASVSGIAVVDGVKTRLNLIEPIGKSGKVKRQRIITSTLSEKDRDRLGFNLSPVVFGDVDIEIAERGKREFYTVDLTKARVEFPWVGWRKGEGIPAKGSFELSKKKNVYSIANLKFSGKGFGASGNLAVSKKGLLSANIQKLKLNEGDNIAVKVKLEGNIYNINAAGSSFDARGLINTLIYESSFDKAQGAKSVNLVANFGQVRGFGNRVVNDILMLYESRKGKLRKLDLKGTDRFSKPYNVQATRSDDKTFFNIKTSNAGNALAFTNIYTKMRDGVLDAKLVQRDNGPYVGPVQITDFLLINEPRLAGIAGSRGGRQIADSKQNLGIKRADNGERVAKFKLAQSQIEKGKGYMNLKDAVIRSTQVGMSMNGVLYDTNDQMNIRGTFMPANAINLAVSSIPLLGQLFSNGRDSALIGITYRLRGKWNDPQLQVNPLSVVAPGIFKKVFEFK